MESSSVLLSQHPIWDFGNAIEIHIVILLQSIFRISQTKSLWKKFSFFGSSSLISITPTIFYALGKYQDAVNLSRSLMCYALLSSLGKYLCKRRRPGTYPSVIAKPTTSMKSFPSRHTMGMTVLACFTPYKYQLVLFMSLNRIIMAKHFVTDCVAGYLIGELAVYMGTHITNLNILMTILFAGMWIWKSATRIAAGTIPILVAPELNAPSILALPIIAVKYFVMDNIKERTPKSERIKVFILDMLFTSMIASTITVLASNFQIGDFVRRAFESATKSIQAVENVTSKDFRDNASFLDHYSLF